MARGETLPAEAAAPLDADDCRNLRCRRRGGRRAQQLRADLRQRRQPGFQTDDRTIDDLAETARRCASTWASSFG